MRLAAGLLNAIEEDICGQTGDVSCLMTSNAWRSIIDEYRASQNDACLLLGMLDKLEAGRPLSSNDEMMRESIRHRLGGGA